MGKIFRAPIFQFIFFGALLYLIYTLIFNYLERSNKVISVSVTQVELLKDTFKKTWNRSPNEAELEAQIQNYIMDEVFYKEAVAQGLDKNDPAIKRRLRQVMEMIFNDYSAVYPTEDQLQKYLSENSEEFRHPSKISFEHIYFKQEEKDQAIKILAKYREGSSIDKNAGRAIMLIPNQFEEEYDTEIERLFGLDFTSQLFELDLGSWQGPVESPYGWHLVNVSNYEEGKIPDLLEIWDEVEREWMQERRQAVKAEHYEMMKSKYRIIIDAKSTDKERFDLEDKEQ